MPRKSIKKTLAFASRLARLQGKMTLREFGDKLNEGCSTLHNYLKGRDPKLSFGVSICKKLGVNPNWLFLGKGSPYLTTEELNSKATSVEVLDEKLYKSECQVKSMIDAMNKYRKLSIAQQKVIMLQADKLTELGYSPEENVHV